MMITKKHLFSIVIGIIMIISLAIAFTLGLGMTTAKASVIDGGEDFYVYGASVRARSEDTAGEASIKFHLLMSDSFYETHKIGTDDQDVDISLKLMSKNLLEEGKTIFTTAKTTKVFTVSINTPWLDSKLESGYKEATAFIKSGLGEAQWDKELAVAAVAIYKEGSENYGDEIRTNQVSGSLSLTAFLDGDDDFKGYYEDKKYTLTFAPANGEENQEITNVPFGTLFNTRFPKTDPTKIGYNFGGWSDGDDIITSSDFITKTTTLTADYDEKAYSSSGISVDLDKYAYDGTDSTLKTTHLSKTPTVETILDSMDLSDDVAAVFDTANYGVNLLDENGKIDLTSISEGAKTFAVFTDANDGYSFSATVARLIIYDKTDLDEMITVARDETTRFTNTYTSQAAITDIYGSGYEGYQDAHGYYILADDIDYENGYFDFIWYEYEDHGFDGTFDGRGHTISNLKVRDGTSGLFGVIKPAGIIKNVAFTNVQNTDDNKLNSSKNRRVMLAFGCSGTVENVYIQGSRGIIDTDSVMAGAIAKCKPGARINNFVVVLSEDESINTESRIGSAIGWVESSATATNIVGVSSHYVAIKDNGGSVTNVQSFSSIDGSDGSYSSSDWDGSIWNYGNGYPIFKGMVWRQNLSSKGSLMDYDLNLSSELSQEFSTTHFNGEVVEIKDSSDTVLSGWTYDNGELTVARAFATGVLGSDKYGDYMLTVKTNNDGETAIYTVKISIVTMIIHNKADLTAMGSVAGRDYGTFTSTPAYGSRTFYKDGDGYFILADNIDYGNDEFDFIWYENTSSGFRGIFDGRGYTISNLKVKDGTSGLFGVIQSTGVVRNVAFKNVQNTHDNRLNTGNNRRNMLAYLLYGTIDNVYIDGSRGEITGPFSGVVGQYNSGATVKNLVSVITETADTTSNVCVSSAIGSMQAKATDANPVKNIVGVSSLYSGTEKYSAIGNNGSWGTAVQSFANAASADGTYSATDWDTSIWDISGGIPVFVSND